MLPDRFMFNDNIYSPHSGFSRWPNKERFLFFGVVGLALVLRLYFILGIKQPGLTGDETYYDLLVRQLLEIGVFGYRSHTPNAYITPGYPMFLAVIYTIRGYTHSPLLTVRFVQALVSAVSIIFIYLIARRIGGPRVAFFSALIAAAYPPMFWSASALLTEALFTCVFLIYFYLMTAALDTRSLALSGLSGVLFGAGVLIRPQVAPFFIVPFLIVYLQEKRREILVMFMVFSIFFGAAMMPWWVRNYLTLHKVVLSATQTGNPLLGGTDPYNRLGAEKLFRGVSAEEQKSFAIKRIVNGFRNETLLYLKWFTVGKFSIMYKDPWVRFTGNFLRPLANLHLPIVILGWLGLLFAFVRPKLRIMAAVVFFVTLVQLIFIPLPRYVFPLIPFLIISSVYLLGETAHLFLKKKDSPSF